MPLNESECIYIHSLDFRNGKLCRGSILQPFFLIRCFQKKEKAFQTFRLRISLRQSGQMDNLQYLYCDGIPFGRQELHPHPYIFIYLYTTHTCAQTTHKCLRALPADELGHFSLPCLRGIKCVIMELSHNEPKLWIDKSQL